MRIFVTDAAKKIYFYTVILSIFMSSLKKQIPKERLKSCDIFFPAASRILKKKKKIQKKNI